MYAVLSFDSVAKNKYLVHMLSTSPTTAQDADFYWSNGYIRYENFFTVGEIASLRQAIDHAIDTRRARIKGAANSG